MKARLETLREAVRAAERAVATKRDGNHKSLYPGGESLREEMQRLDYLQWRLELRGRSE